LLRELGIEPRERWPFRLADERQREFDVGTAQVRIDGRSVYTPVVFGDDTMEPILGATTLEELRLAVDPVGRRLVSVPGLLITLGPDV
jgi:predicted aspartyl protease